MLRELKQQNGTTIMYDDVMYRCEEPGMLFYDGPTEGVPVIPEGIICIKDMFNNCTWLKEAPIIPDSVLIADRAFRNCTALKEAPKLPFGLLSARYMFVGCTSLEKPTDIPRFANTAGMYQGCTALKVLPERFNKAAITTFKDTPFDVKREYKFTNHRCCDEIYARAIKEDISVEELVKFVNTLPIIIKEEDKSKPLWEQVLDYWTYWFYHSSSPYDVEEK